MPNGSTNASPAPSLLDTNLYGTTENIHVATAVPVNILHIKCLRNDADSRQWVK